ncbi:hypothetical protein [Cryobacterium sp. M23]|uniref:hypothetical protein n=1 Tax=Cryobacterium sp. M23 TaxID=2048292 RepID=UPI000CE2EFFD|nr:hypothetical protein [Cryobacterium sp. M23]
MNGTNSQENLYAKAEALWLKDPDPDPRSACYAEADKNSAHRDASRPTTAKRPANWVSALYGYEDYWRENGRTPRERTRNLATPPAEERRRGEWARYQRRFEDKLCRYQLLRLDVSPAFKWDPHDQAWQENFDACVQHVDLTGKLPYLNGADKVEFALARWLGRQLRQLQMGTQPESRAAQLTVLMALQNTGSGLRHSR